MNFAQLIAPELAARLEERGITEASPIQAESLPHTLAGRDLIGRARTGTGKTLAFALPIIMKLEPSRERARLPRAIVVAPTRELAKQVADEFSKSGVGLTTVTVYGGAAYGPQENALRRGVDVVVGTPGRLIDHLERGNLDLSAVQFAVLDEADEMLSVGFADAIETILQKTPEERQTMLFSATLNNDIKRLSRNYLKDPLIVDMVGEGKSQAAQTVEHLKVKVGRSRTRVLADLLTVYNPEKAIVFTRTKREADELANELIHRGLESEALHGDLAQTQRERALGAFRSGRVGVLVATDVAARGLDIPEVDLVVQYHLPQDPESYVHRSGRTGRAGRTGTAIIMYGDRENREVMGLERITGVRFKERPLPTPSEVAQASARASSEMVRRVDPEAAQGFQAEAEQLFSELGLEALARALAKISGVTEPAKAASLLSGEEGLTTLILHGERLSVPRTVALIARAVDVDTRRLGKVRQWRGGTVADVPSEFVEKLMAAAPLDGQVEVQVAQELPELFEQPTRERRDGGGYQGGRGYRDRDEGGRGGYGRGGNSGGGRGGYGNRGGNSGGRGEGGGRWSRERDERGPRREDFADREFVPNR
ncbi:MULTISPECIES: DEAD/DEAH box helicase [Deinococcus]|mgnify:CR=1 FL=1|jgi:ATP-dependent RNA helicase DbpA (EC 5.99.1.-)|uniref:DEAD/DEAH box helicase n=1 Tax=Deinococcus radiodurans TaxID=1299 RepID=UPI000481555E|nr:DEAD/DEAH box helicase [Deinococcus radiodurans]ANC71265.1 RNA helicase [Deinococcus radiodurans R1 = ATCC 13939 = DSM 20539]QEM71056.1 RNA helicase [Deinococcus radiodurans]QIP29607.1 DEAD/DEAH box helicase [Deinococcus radiodurans]QIP31706.1 DEAD/DEAH box helicase [Deinococcus radiodurans]UDL00710.1 DEAD/DEAH box helicase [Deinococcus radiodurans R1 = ATCC 13939 = DSM 20539]